MPSPSVGRRTLKSSWMESCWGLCCRFQLCGPHFGIFVTSHWRIFGRSWGYLEQVLIHLQPVISCWSHFAVCSRSCRKRCSMQSSGACFPECLLKAHAAETEAAARAQARAEARARTEARVVFKNASSSHLNTESEDLDCVWPLARGETVRRLNGARSHMQPRAHAGNGFQTNLLSKH